MRNSLVFKADGRRSIRREPIRDLAQGPPHLPLADHPADNGGGQGRGRPSRTPRDFRNNRNLQRDERVVPAVSRAKR
jgi:hypothetical protein